jgi:hypothetical protein
MQNVILFGVSLRKDVAMRLLPGSHARHEPGSCPLISIPAICSGATTMTAYAAEDVNKDLRDSNLHLK